MFSWCEWGTIGCYVDYEQPPFFISPSGIKREQRTRGSYNGQARDEEVYFTLKLCT